MQADKIFAFSKAEDLPDGEEKENINNISKFFDHIVNSLRADYPNPAINKLMTLVWRVIGNRLVSTITAPVPSVSFLCEIQGRNFLAAILVPSNWLNKFNNDSEKVLQYGGVIFNASKVVDVYTAKIMNDLPETVHERALAWEAEFLKTTKNFFPNHKFNDYQKNVIDKYPNGIDSCSHIYMPPDFDLEILEVFKECFDIRNI